MRSRKELKQLSKEQLKDHWKLPVLITLLLTVIEMVVAFIAPTESFISVSMVISLLIGSYIAVATCNFFLKFSKNPDDSKFGDLKISFKSILKAIGANIIISIPMFFIIFIMILIISIGLVSAIASNSVLVLNSLILISTLIMVIIIMIISLYFSQVFFILADDESYGCFESIKRSIKLMKGHKWEFFILQLSFIGWLILGAIPLGIGLLWVTPYMNVTLANYYKELANENN